ncbi:MAG: hypothetical protein Q8L29_00240, partial [archaeon]|nr:hypothetical protein [archaeon]
DGFARAILSGEGVPIFIKTARDAKLTPYNWGINFNDISEPVQRVTLLLEGSWGLGLDGYGGWYDGTGCRAFGVSVAGKPVCAKKFR